MSAKYEQTQAGRYEADTHNMVLLASDGGWSVVDYGKVLDDGIPTLSAAKRRGNQLARAKRREPRALLRAELEKAEKQFRLGCPEREDADAWYDTKGLDQGVRIKQEFAVAWRKIVLGLSGKLARRRVRMLTGHGKFQRKRTFVVFSTDGDDRIAVCPNAGPSFKARIAYLDGKPFGSYCRGKGWKVESA
jgi:hypothetical protein